MAEPLPTGEPDPVVGTLRHGRAICPSCAPVPGPDDDAVADVARLWRSNIWPYRQSCAECGAVMVSGLSDWPELFEVPS